MGFWSNHPMGGDEALNVVDLFLNDYRKEAVNTHLYNEEENEKYVKTKLNNIALEELKEKVSICEACGVGVLYAIPFIFVNYKCFNLSNEIKTYLKELLSKSVRCYSKNAASKLDKVDKSTHKDYFVFVLQVFLSNFGEIITGEKSLDGDDGLLSLIISSNEEQKRLEDIEEAKKELENLLISNNTNINDEKFLLNCIVKKPELFNCLGQKLNDREFVKKCVDKCIRVLKVNSEVAKDEEYVKLACKKDPGAFKYVDESFRSDKDFVLQIVSKNGKMLEYASDDLKDSKEVVMQAVNNNAWSIQFASNRLQMDKEIVLKAITLNGLVLQIVLPQFKKDKEIVLAAVSHDGFALQYADGILKSDVEIAKAAVSNCKYAIQYVDDSIKGELDLIV